MQVSRRSARTCCTSELEEGAAAMAKEGLSKNLSGMLCVTIVRSCLPIDRDWVRGQAME